MDYEHTWDRLADGHDLPETGHAADLDRPETGHAADLDLPETGLIADLDLPETGHVADLDLPEAGHAASLDIPEAGHAAGLDLPETARRRPWPTRGRTRHRPRPPAPGLDPPETGQADRLTAVELSGEVRAERERRLEVVDEAGVQAGRAAARGEQEARRRPVERQVAERDGARAPQLRVVRVEARGEARHGAERDERVRQAGARVRQARDAAGWTAGQTTGKTWGAGHGVWWNTWLYTQVYRNTYK